MVKDGNNSPENNEYDQSLKPLSPHKKTLILKLIEDVKAKNLTSLDLSRKNLAEIPASLFSLTSLKELYLEGNQLVSIPGDFFDRLPHLEWLDLRSNQLRSLPCGYLGRHEHLKNLLLENNYLHSLPPELGSVKTLQGLNIRNNPIEFPPKEIRDQGTPVIIRFLRAVLEAKASGSAQIIDYSEIVQKILREPSASVMHNFQSNVNSQLNLISPIGQIHNELLMKTKSMELNDVKHLMKHEKSGLASSAMSIHKDKKSNKMKEEKRNHRYAELHKVGPVQRKLENRVSAQKDNHIKNKQTLLDWQQKTKYMKIEKEINSVGDFQRPIEPYAVDDKNSSKKVTEAKTESLTEWKDREARIRQQIIELNDKRQKISNQMQIQSLDDAGDNLHKAEQLQKELMERKKEYRLSCFSDGY